MLNENLKTLRKQKGLSQEELATRLHVVRQTISKWEKGLSVPDADMLTKLCEVLEVSAGDLLGNPIEESEDNNKIVEQLVRINEQFAIRNRRTKTVLKVIVAIIVGIILFNLLLIGISFISFHQLPIHKEVIVEEIQIPEE